MALEHFTPIDNRLIPFLRSFASDANPRIADGMIHIDITSAVRVRIAPSTVAVIVAGHAPRVLLTSGGRGLVDPRTSCGDAWRIISDAVEHDPEAVATGIAWALRVDMERRAMEFDARCAAIYEKLARISARIQEALTD